MNSTPDQDASQEASANETPLEPATPEEIARERAEIWKVRTNQPLVSHEDRLRLLEADKPYRSRMPALIKKMKELQADEDQLTERKDADTGEQTSEAKLRDDSTPDET